MSTQYDGVVADPGETVCVIGAGPAGLTAVKNLRESGFAVDCYERESSVGGSWNWRHERSPMYASAHMISSAPFTQFPDFPMPDSWPDYPHHSQVLAYLERYVEHFDLRRHIWFGTEVVRVSPTSDDGWDVTTRSTGGSGEGERTSRYAAVVIANGHNWAPKIPEYEGMSTFGGTVFHASAFKDSTQLRGRRVLVVGGGNTGCDIAVEAAQHAAACWHSTRRGYWYVPKYVLGRPADQANDLARALRLPLWFRQWLFHRLLRLTVGDLTRFGLPEPDHKVYETHPIANSQLIYHIGHGTIAPVPDVARFHRYGVELTDGRTIEPDLVILATGYLPRFEFLTPETLDADEYGRPRLHLHAFARHHPTLAVVGMLQADGGIFSLMHWQSVAFARWLRLREAHPAQAQQFWAKVGRSADRRWTGARVKDSTRHWFEVDHISYVRALQRTLDDLVVAT